MSRVVCRPFVNRRLALWLGVLAGALLVTCTAGALPRTGPRPTS